VRWFAALFLFLVLGVFAVTAWMFLGRPGSGETRPPTGFTPERPQVVSGAGIPIADRGPSSGSETGPRAGDASAPGPLCDRSFEAGRSQPLSLPAGPVIRAGAPVRARAWTWVNLWAAWCKPCKEEMPLLSSWAARRREAGAALRVVFLSVDDDERQLRRFLEDQGRSVPDEFRWVPDEAIRSRFYHAIGVEDPPTLPVQVVLDPEGRLRCVRTGSISERDLDEAARLFGW